MEKCTLDGIYDLIISYYIKGYCLQFNKTWIDTSKYKRSYLRLMQYANDTCLYWDDSNSGISPRWDHQILIEKYI